MVIRGKDSDILPIAVVEEMRKRGPGIAGLLLIFILVLTGVQSMLRLRMLGMRLA